MRATLYGIAPSHPTHAARLMLERKGIDFRQVEVPPGTHAAAIRLLGFRGGTAPALRIDGRWVQGSRRISRALDELRPEPRLFPAEGERRRRVEDAERWGEEVLQEVPRLLTRWLTVHRPDMREHMARETGIPMPRVAAVVNVPVARHFARKVGADDTDRVRAALLAIPDHLDRIEALLAEGTLGGPEPNAADFQIAPTIRNLVGFGDLEPLIAAREAADHAAAILPGYPATVPAGMLPAGWLELLRGALVAGASR